MDTLWILQKQKFYQKKIDWTPRALQAGLKYIAAIVPASVLTKMSLENLEQKIGNMEFSHFNNYDGARKWLKSVNN